VIRSKYTRRIKYPKRRKLYLLKNSLTTENANKKEKTL